MVQVIADCSDKQPWQGHSKSKPEQTQTEAQVGGSLPAIDISQVSLPDQSNITVQCIPCGAPTHSTAEPAATVSPPKRWT